MGKFRPYTEKDMPAVHLCAVRLSSSVSRKANNFVHTIVGWDDKCVLLSNQCYYTYSCLLDNFEFLDGSPCGIEEGGEE